MEAMERKTITIIVVVLIVVFAVGVSVFTKRPQEGPPAESGGESGPVSETRAPAPENVTVPEKDSSNVPENVAVPGIVAPSAPTSDSSFRSFDIKVEGDKFVPDTVIVKKGDAIRLSITAVDGDYDFSQPDYGVKTSLPRGKAKLVGFSATAEGKYTFFCESCGGPEKGPIGYIVVVPE
ncbi:hypothetical protein C4587_02935 [Candidatus Parcubacteria bacterium]|nr:MAG: hypothetical protein C4587_02935 [Candidatus Parcubacteria bacterium]